MHQYVWERPLHLLAEEQQLILGLAVSPTVYLLRHLRQEQLHTPLQELRQEQARQFGQRDDVQLNHREEFAEVRLPTLPAAREPAPLEVRLPDGTVLRGGRTGELAELVRALRG